MKKTIAEELHDQLLEATAELTQLRADLARAEGEREEAKDSLRRFQAAVGMGASWSSALDRAELAEQERDTLKAECERLIEETCYLKNSIASAVVADLQNENDKLRAQLTRADEAHKLCAVRMMGLEEERGRLTRENRNLADRIQSGSIRIQLLTDQLTTSREEGHRAGMERAAEILVRIGQTTESRLKRHGVALGIAAIRAESSTLPRTYEHKPPYYAVLMRRWGNIDGHTYVAGVHTTIEAATAQAEQEKTDRAGKYEYQIWQGDKAGGVYVADTCGDQTEHVMRTYEQGAGTATNIYAEAAKRHVDCAVKEAYRQGAEGMREGALKAVEKSGSNHCSCIDRERCASCGTVDEILEDIRVLPTTPKEG